MYDIKKKNLLKSIHSLTHSLSILVNENTGNLNENLEIQNIQTAINHAMSALNNLNKVIGIISVENKGK